MQLYSVIGNSQKLDGGALFGNAPKILWSKWHSPDDENRIELACRCLLIKTSTTTILLEAGIGAFFSPIFKTRYGVFENRHVLLDNLNSLGLSHEQIDYVILSHLHFDHAGGLLSAWRQDEPVKLLFPNARFIVSKLAWERAIKPHPRDRASFIPILNQLLAESNRLEIIDSAKSSLGPNFKFHYSNGHTPGMLLTEIKSPTGPLIFAADLIPGIAWAHLPITMGYDRYPELVIDEKALLLSHLVQTNGFLFYTHDPNIACSKIYQDEEERFKSRDPVSVIRGTL